MLPAFVIGLREGLETVVVIGAITVFLRVRNRGDLLPKIWRATALGIAVCILTGLAIRYVEVNLSWRHQEAFETIVGVAAVLTVTYMVIWMRKFPKDLRRDSDAAAAALLARTAGRGLILLAFFAVLREGFEITVFVVATIGLTGRSAWLSTGGALLGVAAALALGVGVVRGSTHLDVARFFRATALILVLSAAGIAMTTVHTANAAGWITIGQRPQFDLAWLAPPGSVLSSFTTGVLGLQPYPALIEVVVWLTYLVPMAAVVLWPQSKAAQQRRPVHEETSRTISDPTPSAPRRRIGPAWFVAGACVGVLGVGLVVSIPPSQLANKTAISLRRTLFANLNDITCAAASRCVAVGDYLPIDKDSAGGDPDGDGQATHTLAETFNGNRWARMPSPDEGRGGDQFSGVSCPSVTSCVAVGYYRSAPFPASATTPPPDYPLIESEKEGRWHVVAGPMVPPNSVLVSVSCPTSSNCTAVGSMTTVVNAEGSVQSLLVEHFDGQSWTLMPISEAVGATTGFNAVSCPSVVNCVAVGDSAPGSAPTATRPLIEDYEHGTWTATALPPFGSDFGILYDISCVAVTRCVAVGNAASHGLAGSPLVLSLKQSTWTVDPVSLGQSSDVSLTALGCASAADCVVVGRTISSSGKVLARMEGPEWMALRPPTALEDIQAISCLSGSHCLVVGREYLNDLGNTTTLIASLSGDRLAIERGAAL